MLVRSADRVRTAPGNPRILFVFAALALFAVVVGSPARAQDSPYSKVSDPLMKAMAGPDEAVPVIIELRGEAAGFAGKNAAPNRSARLAALRSLRDGFVKDFKSKFPGASDPAGFETVPFVTARLNAKALDAIARDPRVRAVSLDPPVAGQTLESAVAINSTPVVDVLGYTGAGITVATLDTGIDSDHPDLAGKVVAQRRFLSQGQITGAIAEDDNGHGTRVAGVLAGTGVTAPRGIAPGINLVAVKVLDANAAGYLSDVARGLEWVGLQVGVIPGLAVVNMSLGDSLGSPICPCDNVLDYQLLRSVVDGLATTNLMMVAASGNQGRLDRLPAPACLSNVISVGATYDAAFPQAPPLGLGSFNNVPGYAGYAACTDIAPALHDIACFTNRNACLDFIAPGYEIRTATLGGGAVTPYWGTSVAAPHVAATLALMREKAGMQLASISMETALRNSSVPQLDPATGLTFLRIDALAAVLSLPAPPPTRPVWLPVPDVIVGDHEDGDGSNVFVYPDAIDLSLQVSDSDTSFSQLLVSYQATDFTYRINGIQPLTGLENPIAPPPAKQLNLVDTDPGGVLGTDGDPYTLTFRNQAISPVAAPGPFAEPGVAGLLTSFTRTLTLWASDGTTLGAAQVLVHTANDTSDSLSGTSFVVDFRDFENDPTDTGGWLGAITQGSGAVGTVGGLCMTAPLLGDNAGGWLSPEGFIELVDTRVYRFRASVNSTQRGVDAIPFWSLVYNNFYLSDPNKGNNYGGEDWFYDAENGANGVGRPQGRTEFEIWGAPNSVMTMQWRGLVDPLDSAFDPLSDDRNDMSLTFRFLDLDSSPVNAAFDSGTLCMTSLRVDGISIPTLQTTLAYGPPLANATHAPQTSGQSGGVALIVDADATAYYQVGLSGAAARKTLIPYDPSQATPFEQLYPVQWLDDRVYMGRSLIRSNVAGGVEGIDPVNILTLGINTANFELGHLHVTSKSSTGNMNRAASPRLASTTGGAAQPYVTFFHTHNHTLSPVPDSDRFRIFVDMFNIPEVGGAFDGLDPFAIESLELLAVNLSALP